MSSSDEPHPGATAPETHPLDNPVWTSLTGPQSHFAEAIGDARRFAPDLSPFVAVPSGPDGAPESAALWLDPLWSDLLELVGPGEIFVLVGNDANGDNFRPGWEFVGGAAGVQLVATAALQTGPDAEIVRPDTEIVRLGDADAQEMIDLVERTQPGPFRPHTYRLGAYLGIRRAGGLVAMAGERLRPPGYTEISAVCTDQSYRGQGLGGRLVRAVAHGIRERGEIPMLHAAETNVNAIRLYESMGFQLRRRINFTALRTPGQAGDSVGLPTRQ